MSLLTALQRRRLVISVFKKGPDYIDAAWLSRAAGTTCRNLDSYMVESDDLYRSFALNSVNSDIAVIEGNRGLYDGMDISGTHSTAELAKLLNSPVILVVNAAKATRTIAALVFGCQSFDPDVKIIGVILNKVAGKRHREILTDTIEHYCGLSVLGSIPKPGDDVPLIPNRHLGLVTPSEFGFEKLIEGRLTEIADRHLDIDRILKAASDVEELADVKPEIVSQLTVKVKIGYFSDSAFTFYYPENLEALKRSGAELVPVSSVDDSSLPDIDGLYIGGGFPETHAERLAGNRSLLDSVKSAAESGMPIYAECGGLIFLSRSLIIDKKRYPMAEIFPIDLAMNKKPVGHGYTLLEVDAGNPFFKTGMKIKGHEFHYSAPIDGIGGITSCLAMIRGTGCGGGRDGLVYKNTLACYTHIHADGVKMWAPGFVAAAEKYRAAITKGCTDKSYAEDNTKMESSPDDIPAADETVMIKEFSRLAKAGG